MGRPVGMTKDLLAAKLASIALLIIAGCLLLVPARAQSESELYLVSGYPTEDPEANVATRLYRLSEEAKTLSLVLDLLPAFDGTEFIRAYNDKRLLILATPHFWPKRLIILNMDAPCQPRIVDVRSGTFVPLHVYLLGVPDRGLYVAEAGWSNDQNQNQLAIFNLVNGQKEDMDPSFLKYAVLPGLSGLGHEDRPQMDILVDPNGFVRMPWTDGSGKHLIDLGWPALPNDTQAVENKTARWSIDGIEQSIGSGSWSIGTASFDLVYLRETLNPNKLRFELLDKSQRIWRQVVVPNADFINFKPFGTWLAGVSLGKSIQGAFSKEFVDKIRAENRERDNRFGKLLERNPKAELFLYDTATGKDYTIRTDDIESEVLLIENGLVYYRVKDRLYRSNIRNDHVEKPVLLAQDPALLTVYWAFTGPSCR